MTLTQRKLIHAHGKALQSDHVRAKESERRTENRWLLSMVAVLAILCGLKVAGVL